MHHSLAQRPLHFSFHSLFVNRGTRSRCSQQLAEERSMSPLLPAWSCLVCSSFCEKERKERERERESKLILFSSTCGSSVSKTPAGAQEIVIQGDFVDDLEEFIPETWGNVGSSSLLSSLSFIIYFFGQLYYRSRKTTSTFSRKRKSERKIQVIGRRRKREREKFHHAPIARKCAHSARCVWFPCWRMGA